MGTFGFVLFTGRIYAKEEKNHVMTIPARQGEKQRKEIFVEFEGGLDIRIHSETERLEPPAELLLIDSQRRKTGKDPRSNNTYQTIPGSSYEEESIADDVTGDPGPVTLIIDIRNPLSGEYDLLVIGTQTGKYTIEVTAHDRELEPSKVIYRNLNIGKGIVHSYLIQYSNKAGAKIKVSTKQGSSK